MNEDHHKLIGKTATSVSVSVSVSTQQQQQQQLMITTRLTPFSIDNILGRSRDHAPASQVPISSRLSDQVGYANDTGTTRVVVASSRHFQAAPTQELMTSSNLDELQTLLNSKLRHQHQQQTAPPRAPAPAAAPAAPIAPPHHHFHPHQSSTHLSQQPSGVVPVSSLYTQFHRHLGILPSSIDGRLHHYYTPLGWRDRLVVSVLD